MGETHIMLDAGDGAEIAMQVKNGEARVTALDGQVVIFHTSQPTVMLTTERCPDRAAHLPRRIRLAIALERLRRRLFEGWVASDEESRVYDRIDREVDEAERRR